MTTCLSALLLLAGSAAAERLRFGLTYPIAEQDALVEIKARAAALDWARLYRKEPASWQGFQSVVLPEAQAPQTRTFRPRYVVEEDIVDRRGEVLYPKGFAYNPLDYLRLPGRILVIGGAAHHLAWLADHARSDDQLLTAGGDPRALGERLGRAVFVVTETARERLGLKAVPSVIEQQGNTLRITEYAVANNK